ncbi:uncharacterized protein LOC111054701 [Nilaparvata lugens]|nr:uncharacterized protein LOC111054701 [Nilaparvata lugens]
MRRIANIPTMVQAITVLTVLKMLTNAQTTCNQGLGRVVYERLPDQQLQGFDDDVVRDTAPPFRVLEKCQELCLRDRTATNNLVRTCTSFDFQPGSRIASFSGSVVEYEESTCYLTREQAHPEGIGNLVLVPNSVHYTEVCLSSSRVERECPNRHYVFERHARKKLKLPMTDIKEVIAANRTDCEDRCLNEFGFVCRSVSYDATARSCWLSRFTRRSHPELLEDDANSDYLENTCLNAERRCDGPIIFVKEENKRLGGPFEVDIYTNLSLVECQAQCLRAEKYFCRSLEYDEQIRRCIIFEEDSMSQKDDLRTSSSPTHDLYDLVCLDSPKGSEFPENSLTSHLFADGRRPDTAFQRYRNSRLGGEFHSEITGRSLSECLDECLRQASFQCRSAVYSDRFRICRLSRFNQRDGHRIIYDADYDYYENLMNYYDGDGGTHNHLRPDPLGQDTTYHGHGRPPYTPIGGNAYGGQAAYGGYPGAGYPDTAGYWGGGPAPGQGGAGGHDPNLAPGYGPGLGYGHNALPPPPPPPLGALGPGVAAGGPPGYYGFEPGRPFSTRCDDTDTFKQMMVYIVIHHKDILKVTLAWKIHQATGKRRGASTKSATFDVISAYLESERIFYNKQYGFRRGASTKSATFDVISDLLGALDGLRRAVGVFCDLSRAFEMVDHELLLSKLKFYGFRGHAEVFLRSYLVDRYQAVKNDCEGSQVLSEWQLVKRGVPQGSILGPTLFNIFINDLSYNVDGKLVLYADDTTILLEGNNYQDVMEKAKIAMQQLNGWFYDNSLKLNLSKTNFIKFSMRGNENDPAIVGWECPATYKTKFLGIELQANLKWDGHIEKLQKRLYHALFALRTVKSNSNLKTALKVYHGDLPELEHDTVATFADDTAVLTLGDNSQESMRKLQDAADEISSWAKLWKIKVNETKSVQVNFTNRKCEQIPLAINGKPVPFANEAKYLGMTLDARLRWKAHVKKKREELGIRYRRIYWLIGRNSALSTYNKILIYKQILKPIWMYGIQLWGCASKSNVDVIQRFQNKVLRNIVDAPRFSRNADIHRDLGVEFVATEIGRFARKHADRIQRASAAAPFGTARDNCELSDHDSRDLNLNNPAFFENTGEYDYYERSQSRSGPGGDCLDVSQVCSEDGMEFTLKTPEPFIGRIYTYGYYDRCFYRGNGGTANVLRISGAQGYPDCGTQRYGDTMTNIVVVQFSDYVQTGRDKRYNLTCLFRGPGEAVVTSSYMTANSGSPIPIEYLPAENSLSSRVRLLILFQGRPTNTIAVGDPLTFRLEAQDGYNYATDIFATNVIARDPYSGRSVQLIDRYGCPVDNYVFPGLDRSREGDGLEARFNAFKIPESNFLVFEATVRTCRDGCQPAYCTAPSGKNEPSLGRKRREANTAVAQVQSIDDGYDMLNSTEDEEQVREMIEVFESRYEMPQQHKVEKLTQSVCLTDREYYGMIFIVGVLLVILTFIMVSVAMYYKRYKIAMKNAMANNNSHIHPFRDQERSGHSASSLFSFKSFMNPSRSTVMSTDEGGLDLGLGLGLTTAVDPSEPIYTDPSLFERSRSLRSIAVSQTGHNHQ